MPVHETIFYIFAVIIIYTFITVALINYDRKIKQTEAMRKQPVNRNTIFATLDQIEAKQKKKSRPSKR